ncbi:MAG: hypothetical protein Q9182_004519 [Xanthomendoza sp. 2 TL-2023]
MVKSNSPSGLSRGDFAKDNIISRHTALRGAKNPETYEAGDRAVWPADIRSRRAVKQVVKDIFNTERMSKGKELPRRRARVMAPDLPDVRRSSDMVAARWMTSTGIHDAGVTRFRGVWDLTGDDEELEFGNEQLGFPTARRVTSHRRDMATAVSGKAEGLLNKYPKLCGEQAITKDQKHRVALLISTWSDIFVEDVRSMPATDLVTHMIPTYTAAIPKMARPRLFTNEEKEWQYEYLPKLEEAGIITRCNSPWSANTMFPRKADKSLSEESYATPVSPAKEESSRKASDGNSSGVPGEAIKEPVVEEAYRRNKVYPPMPQSRPSSEQAQKEFLESPNIAHGDRARCHQRIWVIDGEMYGQNGSKTLGMQILRSTRRQETLK